MGQDLPGPGHDTRGHRSSRPSRHDPGDECRELSPPRSHRSKAWSRPATSPRDNQGNKEGRRLIDAERQSVFCLLYFLDCRVGWWPAATTLSIDGFSTAIALDIHLPVRGVMDETIDGRECHGLVREDLVPFAERLVGRDHHGSPLITRGD